MSPGSGVGGDFWRRLNTDRKGLTNQGGFSDGALLIVFLNVDFFESAFLESFKSIAEGEPIACGKNRSSVFVVSCG
jgi:hypothetical protein